MSAAEIWTSPPIGDAAVFVHEEWRVVDRWWTDEPIERRYRDVTRDGRRRIEMSDQGASWQEVNHP